METILERQRDAHEDIERLEQAMSDRFLAHPRTIRDKLQLDHETADMLEKILGRSRALRELYNDTDNSRAQEIATLSTAGGIDGFYEHFGRIKDFHKRYAEETVVNLAQEYAIRLPAPHSRVPSDDKIAGMFSGEETFGRYFDLIASHSEFVNLKRNPEVTYIKYLDSFDSFDEDSFPAQVKQDPNYPKYLENLKQYLESWFHRAQPLESHGKVLQMLQDNFENQYKDEAGIWCDICQKMYSKQTVYEGHLNSKKHQAGLSNGSRDSASKLVAKDPKKGIARNEYIIKYLVQRLGDVKLATRSNVARKQTLTEKEWQAEQETGNLLLVQEKIEEEEVEEEDDGTERIHNPLKLPLGWDGKPIPFWLWKLHGLGVEYPCEICGNYVYMGRKAFDNHFVEFRHVHGLRCLGIQNSVAYDQITSIADALVLHERLDIKARQEQKVIDEAIETEDADGNVMSLKLYNELRAQGIL